MMGGDVCCGEPQALPIAPTTFIRTESAFTISQGYTQLKNFKLGKPSFPRYQNCGPQFLPDGIWWIRVAPKTTAFYQRTGFRKVPLG